MNKKQTKWSERFSEPTKEVVKRFTGSVNFDKRLLRNFYLNNGYYDVKINSSFAKMINEDNFELIFNIDNFLTYY